MCKQLFTGFETIYKIGIYMIEETYITVFDSTTKKILQ